MKRITLLIITIALLPVLLFAIVQPATKPAQAAPNAAVPVGIPINRSNNGTIKNTTQGIFGPQICTAYGDPFSPITSPWDADLYTYRYQIRIPADYPNDIVRVELFDPDSVNQAENEHTIALTENALTHPTHPLSDVPPPTKFCGIHGGSSEQKNPCVLKTGELELTPSGSLGVTLTYTIDQVNPFWFARVDENRGAGDPALHGNNQCVP
ncbi:MAG: hypothetical protein KC419_22000, partial [Anaerolineales bacterium]|nr:hypothetical protein [Anaerolineales bacterium]